MGLLESRGGGCRLHAVDADGSKAGCCLGGMQKPRGRKRGGKKAAFSMSGEGKSSPGAQLSLRARSFMPQRQCSGNKKGPFRPAVSGLRQAVEKPLQSGELHLPATESPWVNISALGTRVSVGLC